jgi:hypothetical protein
LCSTDPTPSPSGEEGASAPCRHQQYKYRAETMHQMWRLSEAAPQNLGLACTEDSLLLGRTRALRRPRSGRNRAAAEMRL